MKSYTDIEQSRKLADILPLESADMCYVIDYAESNKYGTDHFKPEVDTYGLKVQTRDNIPCWSLTALLSVIEHPRCFQGDKPTYWFCGCFGKDKLYHEVEADNPVDACYEMILKLHELNLL